MRLFEKTPDGLLVEVPPDEAEARREGRRVSQVVLTCLVLWTADEEAARDVDEAEVADDERERLRGIEMAERRQEQAIARLEARGISAEDLKDAIA